MNVLQPDEEDFCAEVVFVRLGLNLLLQSVRRLQPRVRQEITQIHAREIMHDLSRRQIRQQVCRVAVIVSPVHDIRDLKLHGNADSNEADRRCLQSVIRVGVITLNHRSLAVGNEEILLLIVRNSPENHILLVLARVWSETDVNRLNLLRAVAVNFVHRPWQFQVRTGCQRRINPFSEMLQNHLLTCVNENDAR